MRRLINTCFGLGWLPIAPGTWGSLPVAIIFGLLCAGGASLVKINVIMMGLIFIGSVACIAYAPASIKATKKNDPSEVVIDEFAGQSLTFLAVLATQPQNAFFAAATGFILFRIFDILKPWPANRLEALPSGFGILADDLMAGIYASILFNLCLLLGLPGFLTNLIPNTGGVTILSGAVLGAVQGLTEFIPVSSDGHLVLFEHFFGLKAESTQMLAFDLSVHLGTVLAIIFVFWQSMISWFKNLLAWRKYGNNAVEIYKKSPSIHILVLAIIANIATALIGFPLKDYFQEARGSLMLVAILWVVTGTFLIICDLRKRARIGLREFGMIAAVVVGIAQASALLPAISRSGMTICAAVLIGLHRRWAVEFSFLCGIPAILGAAAVQFIKEYNVILNTGISIGSIIVGPIVAAVVGVIALKILIKATRRGKFKYFGFYCYGLAAFVMLYLLFSA
jgi:undecaprenyl-diphosphatase